MALFHKKEAPAGPEFPEMKDLNLQPKKETGQYVYAIIGVLVAAAIFCGLVFLERYINTPKHSTMTVVASKAIPKGTVLTEDNWKDYLTGIQMDDVYRPKDALSSVNKLIGTKTVVAIGKGSILSTKETISTKDIENSFTDPVEVSMAISVENADAGLLRKGDLVNFMITTNNDGDLSSNSVMENVYIKNAYDSDGNPIATSDSTTRAGVIQILLSKDDQPTFGKAIAGGGTMTISRVVDTATGYERILNKDNAAAGAADAQAGDSADTTKTETKTESLNDGTDTTGFSDTTNEKMTDGVTGESLNE